MNNLIMSAVKNKSGNHVIYCQTCVTLSPPNTPTFILP